MGLSGEGTSEDELWDVGNRDAIAEHLRDLADARLEAREGEVGEADWKQVERLVLLRTIDTLWVEHLTELDDMRRGIGLRGYAQQDPLNEFRREAYRMYEEFRGLIRHGVASSIFRVTVQRQPPPDEALAQSLARGAAALTGSARDGDGRGAARGAPATVAAGAGAAAARAGGPPAAPAGVRNVRESLGDAPVGGDGGGAGAAGGIRPGYTPAGERIGRNDACWCGSGVKYKKCHGR
jgi:preprotein translocase subunit SecA